MTQQDLSKIELLSGNAEIERIFETANVKSDFVELPNRGIV